jgi:hypothetical protein
MLDKTKIIKMAGHSHLVLSFVYHGKREKVEPYEIDEEKHVLRARDIRQGTMKDYAINRMFQLEITEQDFMPKMPIRF